MFYYFRITNSFHFVDHFNTKYAWTCIYSNFACYQALVILTYLSTFEPQLGKGQNSVRIEVKQVYGMVALYLS